MEKYKASNSLLALLLMAVAFVVYQPCLRGHFLWDDDAYISQNQELNTVQGLKNIWLTPGSVQQYYPMTFSVFWAEHHLWKLNTLGYHVLNVLLHGFNAILLWVILDGLGLPGAWIAAWLFALHPVMAESVAWMTELKNTLSMFFYLLTLQCLLKKKDGVALALFTCALFSKSVTVTLPVVYLLISLWMKKAWDKKTVIRMLPFFGAGLAAALFTIHVEHHFVRAQGALWDFNGGQRLMIAGKAFWFYLSKLFYPSSLAFIYPRWTIDSSMTYLYAYMFFALALLGTAAYGQKWWGKLPFACLLFFTVSLAPTLGFSSFYFMRYSFVADHFQYLASLGIFTLAGWAIARGLEFLQVPLPSPLGIAVIVLLGTNLALATHRQAKKYSYPLTLWADTLRLNSDSAIAHHNMGIALTDEGHWNEAVAHLRTAEALDPSFVQTHLALAYLAQHANRREDALHQYQEAIRLGVNDPVVLKDYAALRKN